MRHSRAIALGAILCALLASFVTWWNYGAIQWNWPRYGTELRKQSWRLIGDPFDWQRRRIAGFRFVNCSDAARESVAACIARAQQVHRGFQVRRNFRGIDSYGVSGLAGDEDGAVYEVTYDIYREFVSVWRRRCPEPLQVGTDDTMLDFVVTCFPEANSDRQIETLRNDLAEHIKAQKR